MDKASTKADKASTKTRSCVAVINHPLRIRILELVNETPMSPSEFVREGHVPEEEYENYHQALSLASYHFRELEKGGCLEEIESIQRRGALEHVYTGTGRVFFSDEEFERMPFAERQQLSKTSFLGLTARTDGAIRMGSFDNRTDRHLTWRALHLDQQGWEGMMKVLADAYYAAEAVREEAEARMDEPGWEGDVIPSTFAILGFESPPPSMRS